MALQVVSTLDISEIGGDVLLFGKLVEISLALGRTDGIAVLSTFGVDAIDLYGLKLLDLLAILEGKDPGANSHAVFWAGKAQVVHTVVTVHLLRLELRCLKGHKPELPVLADEEGPTLVKAVA